MTRRVDQEVTEHTPIHITFPRVYKGVEVAGLHIAIYPETRRHGDTETRRHGDTETRRHGDTETRRHGDTETRRHRDTETQRHITTQTGFAEMYYEHGSIYYTIDKLPPPPPHHKSFIL